MINSPKQNNPTHNLGLNGILIINKPFNWTSFDVVKKVRNLLHVKKVGHTGTLDPMATGVLVLCLGKATKKVNDIMAQEKEYVCEITLGATSNTDDADGEVIKVTGAKKVSKASLESLLSQFIGEIEQMPPQFSAKKVQGQRAYDLARQGKTVDLKPHKVKVYSIELVKYKWPKLVLKIVCGKGFYVRSLARDLGHLLKIGGYLSMLVRSRVGEYTLERAVPLEEVSPQKVLATPI